VLVGWHPADPHMEAGAIHRAPATCLPQMQKPRCAEALLRSTHLPCQPSHPSKFDAHFVSLLSGKPQLVTISCLCDTSQLCCVVLVALRAAILRAIIKQPPSVSSQPGTPVLPRSAAMYGSATPRTLLMTGKQCVGSTMHACTWGHCLHAQPAWPGAVAPADQPTRSRHCGHGP
jgi:hypothetical protein